MYVDLLHAAMAVSFLVIWAMIGQIAVPQSS